MSDENKSEKEKNTSEAPENNVHVIDDEEGSLEDFAANEDKGSGSDVDGNGGGDSDLAKELEKVKNDFLYLKAEFDNFKKRTIKERSDLVKYGGERIFVEILDVVDNFERALSYEVNPDSIEQFVSGIQMIHSSLSDTLKRLGISEIESQGKDFDPNFHEALGTEPTDKQKPGTITQVVKKPYMLHDKVIRPGQVIVAKESEPETDNETSNPDTE